MQMTRYFRAPFQKAPQTTLKVYELKNVQSRVMEGALIIQVGLTISAPLKMFTYCTYRFGVELVIG